MRLRQFGFVFGFVTTVVFIATMVAPSAGVAASSPSSQPTASAPPQIIHLVTTALCVRMHQIVRPAVGMVLENDQFIAKSPRFFEDYRRNAFDGNENGMSGSPGNYTPQGDSINVSNPGVSLALQRLSYLVHPIAQNLISAQTLLDSPELTKPTGNAVDDAKLAKIRAELLQTIATQSASLDVINGFVQTQQMGALQHAGQEYIGAITGSDTTTTFVQNTPNPYQDPNAPGLPQNPYNLDLSTIPGLSVGYNPIKNLMSGLDWLRGQTAKQEDTVASSVTGALKECDAVVAPAASPH